MKRQVTNIVIALKLADEIKGTLPSTVETTPYLPDDSFKKVPGTDLSKGLVIEDKYENQYVWVEVPKSLYNNINYNSNNAKKPSSSTDYANIEYCLQQYTATYRNGTSYSDEYYPDDKNVGWFADATAYNNLKNSMLKSVYENGGFYVGRYEAGIDTTTGTNRTSKGPTNSDGKYTIEGMPTPVSKADAYPYTYVTRTPVSINTNGLTKVADNKYKISIKKVGEYYVLGPIKLNGTNNVNSSITLKTTDKNGNEITDYKISDSEGNEQNKTINSEKSREL